MQRVCFLLKARAEDRTDGCSADPDGRRPDAAMRPLGEVRHRA
ncbi:hypothetical protein [Streptomyces sp. SID5785]|nr:hypothetical protein [Streptomyces sp. SID5785]